jgi:hypothetical protein
MVPQVLAGALVQVVRALSGGSSLRSGSTVSDFQRARVTSPGGWPRRFETSAPVAAWTATRPAFLAFE